MGFDINSFDLSHFSNQELFELQRNQEKIPELAYKIEEEIIRRRIDAAAEIERINHRLDFKYGEDEKKMSEPLALKNKWFISFLPFFTRSLLRSFLKKGNLRKSKEYWKYFTAGWLFYTALFFLILVLIRKHLQ